jgi:hypothetical protein
VIFLFIVLMPVNINYSGTLDLVISSLNGHPITPTKQIFVGSSDVVGLDVVYTGSADRFLFSTSFDIVVTGSAALDGSQIAWPTGWDPVLIQVIPPSPGTNKLGISTAASDRGVAGPSAIVLNHILLHPNGGGEVLVGLQENPNLPAGVTFETDQFFNLYPVSCGSGVTLYASGGASNPPCWLCPGQTYGDTNGDNYVSTLDLLALRKAWMTTSAGSPHGIGNGQYNCCADFDKNGSVGTSDLLLLKQNWLKSGFGTCSNISCP